MAHTYEVTTRWKEGLRGEAQPAGVPDAVPFAVPKEFGGPGGEWTPEHLLAAAVSSCILATFLSIAQMSKLSIRGYESSAACSMDKVEGALRVTGVTVAPRVTVASEGDRDRALRLLEKAEKLCPISNALKAAVTFQPSVEVAG
ncbi:MAG: OsmC family protein [Planctomycetes bacterium]|nr:OsmC family protein [Planctomycetota bacterium]